VVGKLGPQCVGILVAAIFVAAPSATRAEEAVKTIPLRPNFISTFTTDKPFKTVLVGNPKIVEVTVQDDRTVVLTPQTVGETNIIFLDERNVRITSINVLIDEGVGTSRVKIHNKALVTSFTAYRCWENRCEYVDEVTAKEPVELPRGNLNQSQNFNENINSTTLDKTPRQQ
jgi:Flp pilus assembly secretin CpaC